MVRTAWRVLGRHGGSEAEDAVQEAFLAALTTGALPAGDVGAWLRAITVRKALDALRQVGRRRAVPPADPVGEGPTLPVLIVRQALERLAPLDRAVLVLVDLEGCSMAEAASVLGSTRVALRWRAVRARRRLARLLGEDPRD